MYHNSCQPTSYSNRLPTYSQVSQQQTNSMDSLGVLPFREQPTPPNNYSQWKPWGKKRRTTRTERVIIKTNSRVHNVRVEDPEEIANYIEERRRKWPGAKRMEQSNTSPIENNNQLNALQLVAQTYQEETDDTVEATTTSMENSHRKQRVDNQERGNSTAYSCYYRPNLFTLFVEKHKEKQQKLLIDFIGFLYRQKFLQTS